MFDTGDDHKTPPFDHPKIVAYFLFSGAITACVTCGATRINELAELVARGQRAYREKPGDFTDEDLETCASSDVASESLVQSPQWPSGSRRKR